MELNIRATVNPRISALFKELGPAWRKNLYGVGANALRLHLRRYIRNEAQRRHITAGRLGGTPTGHLAKGAARITSSATEYAAIVNVPIAGITRAFRDLIIRPKNTNALTIPISAAANGHTVRELRRMGWSIFRPIGKDYLMGTQDGGDARLLYALRKKVIVRKDRTLLPSSASVSETINKAVVRAVRTNLERISA